MYSENSGEVKSQITSTKRKAFVFIEVKFDKMVTSGVLLDYSPSLTFNIFLPKSTLKVIGTLPSPSRRFFGMSYLTALPPNIGFLGAETPEAEGKNCCR